ncbi:hypothetical protein CNYM01_08455 [Colletotrichum nymphaeae SA-01]|uniref:Zn(2)-C6 fungal-type domain-containing protein n=1 Tax=Colletotrichum nymphaeae SA-01 TaxID=1460502 RepID=A0A135UF30_9PEZI|nr:hypothetical protein CNYM01_08455 [Colletotrichum nymphaeae SA-01]
MLPAPQPSLSPEIPEKRRCWECQRRRLVCDSVKPVCNKCRASGIVCPGYDDRKPLTWLAPGKVTCRTRRKGRVVDKDTATKTTMKIKPKLGRRGEIEDTEALTRSRNKYGGELVFHSALRTDICDVFEAVQYFNDVFYPYTKSGHPPTSNVFIAEIPLKVVKYLPISIAHNLVGIVYHHRMHVQKEWKNDCPSILYAQHRMHHHRGLSIRAINEDLANPKTQSSDVVLTGVILLLQSEINACITPQWRQHVDGLLAILACRGGARGWAMSEPYRQGLLLSFMIVMTSANTTSPPDNQVTICDQQEFIDLIQELYPLGLHPHIPCPMPLFLEISRINHLRAEVSRKLMDKSTANAVAGDIVARIESFDGTDCDSFYEDRDHRDLIAAIFHSAVAVFCISSLQSVGALPRVHRLTMLRTMHGNRLYSLMEETRNHPQLKKSVQWPLVVAGIEASVRVDKRRLVAELYLEQAKDIATPLPLHAKNVMRTFWDGDATDWDACCDQPYAFVS